MQVGARDQVDSTSLEAGNSGTSGSLSRTRLEAGYSPITAITSMIVKPTVRAVDETSLSLSPVCALL